MSHEHSSTKGDPTAAGLSPKLTFQQKYIAQSLATDYRPDANTVMGPNSAEFQLALLGCGTVGRSFREIIQALGVEAENAAQFVATPYFHNLVAEHDALNRAGSTNGTYVRESIGFITTQETVSAFNEAVAALGGVIVNSANSNSMTDDANKWAAQATATPTTPSGLINPLLTKPLNPLSMFVTLTADAFDLLFASPFDPRKTREEKFMSATNAEWTIDMMNKKFSDRDDAIYFRKKDNTQGVVLPYGIMGQFSLRATEIPAEFALNASGLSKWYSSQVVSPVVKNSETVQVYMPRARIEGERDTKPTRNALGIRGIYTTNEDFAGTLVNPENIYISESRETAIIKINEVRTEGAIVQRDVGCLRCCGGEVTPQIRLDTTYLIEVVVGIGLPSPGGRENILMAAVVNNPGRLPAPAIKYYRPLP